MIVSMLVDGFLADDAPGLFWFLKGDPLIVKFLQFPAVEDLEVLPLFRWGQLGW